MIQSDVPDSGGGGADAAVRAEVEELRMRMKLIGGLFALLVLAGSSYQQDAKFAALFVFNFAKYVEWPAAQSSGEFTFVVLGKDPMYDELKTIAEKTKLDGRAIVVRQVDGPEQAGACHIMYVSPGKSDALQDVLGKVAPGTLVVANRDGLGAKGASINLVMIDGKQRYEINPEGLKKAGLVAKPVLFKLGKVLGS